MSCTRVTVSPHETVPLRPLLKSPPSGITDQTRNAGTTASSGARRNTHLSAWEGSRSSLKNSFMPSARVCSNPFGPALLGPIRFCMPATTLRSNQTMNIVPTSASTKITSTLAARNTRTSDHQSAVSSIGSWAMRLV